MTPEQKAAIEKEALEMYCSPNGGHNLQTSAYIAGRTKSIEEVEQLQREIEGQDYWPKLSEVEKENQSLQSELAHYKALAEAADKLINHNGWGNDAEWKSYQSLKQKQI